MTSHWKGPVEAQRFLAPSEVEGIPDIRTRAQRDSSGGRSFSLDTRAEREAVPLRVEAQRFLALSEVEGSPAKIRRREAPSPLVEGQGFSPDITTRAKRLPLRRLTRSM